MENKKVHRNCKSHTSHYIFQSTHITNNQLEGTVSGPKVSVRAFLGRSILQNAERWMQNVKWLRSLVIRVRKLSESGSI